MPLRTPLNLWLCFDSTLSSPIPKSGWKTSRAYVGETYVDPGGSRGGDLDLDLGIACRGDLDPEGGDLNLDIACRERQGGIYI